MPRCDGTGPKGEGRMTGLGSGKCTIKESCCKRNTLNCKQDLETEKKILEERLEEINKELNK